MERPILVERVELAGIPALHVRARALAGPAPTVFYFHGWSSKKELNVIPAELLAMEGFRVIVPEQIHHGERDAFSDYDAKAKTHFWKVILNSIGEAALLQEAAVDAGWSDPSRTGVAGSSMGGFVASGILARYDWAKAAVLNNGCPSYCWAEAYYKARDGHFPADPPLLVERLAEFDPERYIERIAPRPLLMQHGDADTSVPVGGVQRFRELAAPYYADCPDRLQLTVIARLNHFTTNHMMEAMRGWFLRWL